jgi:hypothetical protein
MTPADCTITWLTCNRAAHRQVRIVRVRRGQVPAAMKAASM